MGRHSGIYGLVDLTRVCLNLKRRHRLTGHALLRLSERSSLREVEMLELLDMNLSVLIGFEDFTSIAHRVVFISLDQNFLVAVVDTKNDEVMTLLPLDYWRTLRANRGNNYRIKCDLTRELLLKAIQLVCPDHEFLKHPPVSAAGTVYVTLRGVRHSDGKNVSKRAGRVTISSFLDFSDSEAEDWIKNTISNGLATYPMSVQEIIVSGSKRLYSFGDVRLVYNLTTAITQLRSEVQMEFRRRVRNGNNFPVVTN